MSPEAIKAKFTAIQKKAEAASTRQSASRQKWTVGFFLLFVVFGLAFFLTSKWWMPVSYTHLDVYKRQLLFRVYIIGVSWVARTFDGLAQAFAMFGFSWALIDGPNIIQKILGIDAGLSSAFHTVMGVYQGARMAAGLAKGTMHAAKTGMHAAAKAAGGVALATAAVGGYTAGKAKGIHDYVKEKQEAAKNQGRAGTIYGYSSFDRTLNAGEHPPKLGDGKQPEANGAPPVEPRSHGTPGMDTSQSEHSEAQNLSRIHI